MAKREALNLNGIRVETGPDWNSRYWIGYRKGCSMFFRDVKVLRKWLGLPVGTTSRQAFDSWVASIEAEDAERAARKGAQPLTSEEPVQPTAPSLSQELLETGFGPEVFSGELDESDPNHSTRVIT